MSIVVSRDQVEAVVEGSYGLRLVRQLVGLPPGVHSQTWLAATDDGEWVVKISDVRCDSLATLSAQCQLFDFLNSRGLQTPVVRADQSGHRVSVMGAFGTPYPVTVMRHRRLGRLAPESVTADELRHVAAQVARLHATMDEFVGKDETVADREKSENEWGRQVVGCHPSLMESPTAECFSASERSWFEATDTALLAYLDANFPDPGSLSQAVLHGDLSFEHVRMLPNRDVYFFDFGDMCWGPVAHELAQFLRGFRDVAISPDRWADLRRWLLEGYRSRRVFTTADAAAIDVFLLNRVVALAKYVLELNGDQASVSGAEAIKSAYRLAQTVLTNRSQ